MPARHKIASCEKRKMNQRQMNCRDTARQRRTVEENSHREAANDGATQWQIKYHEMKKNNTTATEIG